MFSIPLRPILLALMLASLALTCGGCSQQHKPSAVEVTLVFENVRLVRSAEEGKPPILDEWGQIKRILGTHSARPPTERILRERQPIGRTAIRDYESSVLLGSFAKMDDIDAELKKLRGERQTWWDGVTSALVNDREGNAAALAEPIEYQLVGVEALYRSNYIATAIEITVRGSTTPGATVTLYINRGTSPEVVTADRRGYFSKKLPSLPADRYIYGESRLERTPAKYFRIDVLTQQQDALTEEDFRDGIGSSKK